MALFTDSVTAGNILADCLVNSIRNYGRFASFRSTVNTALTHPATAAVLYKRASTIPESLREYLPDPPPPNSPIYTAEGRNQLAQEVMQNELTSATDAINAASFIFAHSILDDVATQCCQVVSLMDPESFRQDLAKKKMDLDQFEGTSFEARFDEMLKKVILSIGKREGLVNRIQRVIGSAKPQLGTTRIADATYTFDKDRIRELDKIRHGVVHGASNVPDTRNVEEDLAYMQLTAQFIMNSLMSRFFLNSAFHSLLIQRFQSSLTKGNENVG